MEGKRRDNVSLGLHHTGKIDSGKTWGMSGGLERKDGSCKVASAQHKNVSIRGGYSLCQGLCLTL